MSHVWFNGAVSEGAILLDARDRGLTLGDGLFETVLVVNGAALWINMHLARMEASAQELGLPFNRAATDTALTQLLQYASDGHDVLRVTLTRGPTQRGLAGNGPGTLLMTLDRFDPQLMFRPVSLLTSSVRRGMASPAARHKTLSYADNIMAAREAASRASDDALMLNSIERVACSTVANIFFLKGQKLVTPSRDQAILTGVMRQAVLAAARHLGLTPEERAVKPAELLNADAVFLTNSLRFIYPVKSLDQQPLAMADLTQLIDGLCESARLQCSRDPRLL